MIRDFALRVQRLLSSAALALWLLAFVGIWSTLATMIPQTSGSPKVLEAWVAKYTAIEPAVHAVGLHEAFSSPAFIAVAALLALSTALCSWKRTRAALHMARMLRSAHSTTAASLAEKHDFALEIPAEMSGEQAMGRVSSALTEAGFRTRSHDGVLVSASPWWSVWGSAIFHWALLALIIAAFGGTLLRTEGAMSLAVGQSKPDAPQSYDAFSAGRLHRWAAGQRTIRVDALEPDFQSGGIDRGAVPTVSILDSSGKAVLTQQVYPNKKLHSGSLSINAPGVGLAVGIALLDQNGAQVGSQTLLADFSQTATEGTVPSTMFRTGSGISVYATVPLDRSGDHFGEWVPRQPRARIRVLDAGGKVLLDQVVRLGQRATLPGVGAIGLKDIGWYARLSLVDDPTIPLVYASMIIAMLGLTISLATRQQLLAVGRYLGPDGPRIIVTARLWRNTPLDREELREELTRALHGQEEGTAS